MFWTKVDGFQSCSRVHIRHCTWACPIIHPPICQQVFIECLLCSRLFTRAYSGEQTDMAPVLMEHSVLGHRLNTENNHANT